MKMYTVIKGNENGVTAVSLFLDYDEANRFMNDTPDTENAVMYMHEVDDNLLKQRLEA